MAPSDVAAHIPERNKVSEATQVYYFLWEEEADF